MRVFFGSKSRSCLHTNGLKKHTNIVKLVRFYEHLSDRKCTGKVSKLQKYRKPPKKSSSINCLIKIPWGSFAKKKVTAPITKSLFRKKKLGYVIWYRSEYHSKDQYNIRNIIRNIITFDKWRTLYLILWVCRLFTYVWTPPAATQYRNIHACTLYNVHL